MEKKILNEDDMEIEEDDLNIQNISKEKKFQKVTFDFLEPNNRFSANLIILLRKTFSFVNWEFTTIINSICSQKEFGIFLGIVDEENEDENIKEEDTNKNRLYACLSIINLKRISNSEFFTNLKNFLKSQLSEKNNLFFENNILSNLSETGLLINERVLNLPLMVLPTIYQQLFEDKFFIDKSEDYSEIEKLSYSPKYLIYFSCATYKNKECMMKENKNYKNLLFYKIEDRILFRKSIVFDFLQHQMGPEILVFMSVLKFEDFIDVGSDKKTFV